MRRRDAVLREMGLGPLWRLRSGDAERSREAVSDAGAAAGAAAEAVSAGSAKASGFRRPDLREETPPRPAQSPGPVPSTDRPAADAAARGADRAPAPVGAPGSIADRPEPDRAKRIAALGWDELEADIRACRSCGLCERRKQAVPGVGDRQARWMLVGEGPGAEEDQRGEPFVGQAGRLLDNMLGALGLKRGEGVYIANAVKCRPPHNRTPEAAELAACLPYLRRQIELVQPTLLVALGRPAAQALLDTEIRIGAARGRAHRYGDIPVVVTYHPAYLLRNPQDKAKAWEDLCFARRLVADAAGGRHG